MYMSQDVLTSSLKLLVGLLQPIMVGARLVSASNEGLASLLYHAMLPWLPDMLLFVQDRLINGVQSIVSYTSYSL